MYNRLGGDANTVMKKIETELDKLKFTSFGKVKLKNKLKVSKEVKRLNEIKFALIENKSTTTDVELHEVDIKLTENFIKEQREDLEKGLKALKECKNLKGKSASIFKLKESIVGSKKSKQEPTSIKDPKTNKEIFEPKLIKEKSLDYCVSLLTNREPNGSFVEDIEHKNSIHEVRMMRREPDYEIEYSDDMLYNAIEALKKKGNKSMNLYFKVEQISLRQ